jgi:hypothetical protein
VTICILITWFAVVHEETSWRPGSAPGNKDAALLFRYPQEGSLARDDEGGEFDNPGAAIQVGMISAGEIGLKLARGETGDIILAVRGEQSQRLCAMTAMMEAQRHRATMDAFRHPMSAYSR